MISGMTLVSASFGVGVVGVILLATARSIYNLYFHPLAKFQGPPVAALTGWWQAYIELYKKISLTPKLEELHRTYGQCFSLPLDSRLLIYRQVKYFVLALMR